jgi:hypothetical protein
MQNKLFKSTIKHSFHVSVFLVCGTVYFGSLVLYRRLTDICCMFLPSCGVSIKLYSRTNLQFFSLYLSPNKRNI